ncbi:MAG TPA: LCP family protein [Oscillospiraceae bacterium]|nr:LCP family protein [Oscillospiraceae bacterium]
MNKKRWLLAGVLTVVIVLLTGAVVYLRPLYKAYQAVKNPPPAVNEQPNPETEKLLQDRYYNFLVYGVDTGEWVNGTYRPGEARADTIVLMQLDLENKTVAMLSIPRDTLVEIPGYAGTDKINHAHAFGGTKLLVETVEHFTNLSVDYFIQINYPLFRDVVEAIGGVEFEVDRAIKARGLQLEPGLQVLNGDQAFALVSFRYEAMGDIARVQRQQRFLLALARQVKTLSTGELLPAFYAAWQQIKTNLSSQEAAELVMLLNGLQVNTVTTEIVPGWFYNRSGVSYWRPNEEETKALITNIFRHTDKTKS